MTVSSAHLAGSHLSSNSESAISLPFRGLAGPGIKANWLKISLAKLEMMLACRGNIWNS